MFIVNEMRYAVIFFLVILSFQKPVSAQERDTLVKIAAQVRPGILPERGKMQISRGSAPMPTLSQDSGHSFDFQNPVLTNINFGSLKGWKMNTMPLSGSGSINPFPFSINPIAVYGLSQWNIYQGYYGIQTYRVNDKLFIGTAGFSDRNFNAYLQKSGYLRQTNYSSSLFVGYKFSEKFSISAGFTIQSNGDQWDRNLQMQNGGIFP
jgi:hypothetical protein